MGAASDPAFARAYLDAHKLPATGWVYAYLFWVVVAGAVAVVALASFVPHRRQTVLDAWLRRKLAGRHVQSLWRSPPTPLVALAAPAALWVLVLCLVLIGTDYPDPNHSIWRNAGRVLHPAWSRPAGAPPVTTTAPTTALTYRTWWTVGDRLGLLLNAIVPLVVLLAVRQAPLALLSLRALGGYAFDSLSRLHGYAAWLAWGLATAHTVTWFIQLGQDHTPTGSSALHAALGVARFRWAIVSYIFLTLMCFLSVPPVRRRCYALFHLAHIVCGMGFLIAGALHHPPLAPWLWAALALWMADRALRLVLKVCVNFPAAPLPPVNSSACGEKAGLAALIDQELSESSSGIQLIDRASISVHEDLGRVTPIKYPRSPSMPPVCAPSPPPDSVLDQDSIRNLPGSFSRSCSPGKAIDFTDATDAPRPSEPYLPLSRALASHVVPGYAFAQLLPGHLVRLTLRVPRPQPWFPGQWLSLSLPEVSVWQSRPFTIAAAVEAAQWPGQNASAVPFSQDGRTVVLLIRARQGFTKRLYQHVAQLRSDARHLPPPAPGVHLRALVDGPYGSAARVPFSRYRTVVAVCAGSGVAYSIAVLQFLCAGMLHAQAQAQQEQAHGHAPRPSFTASAHRLPRPHGKWETTRVHFVWIMRDMAHLVWVATALRKCIEAVPPSILTVDLYVTLPQFLAAPEGGPWVPGHGEGEQQEHGTGVGDTDIEAAPVSPVVTSSRSGHGAQGGLTEFEGEEAEADAHDQQLNQALQAEGALRRARTRTATIKRKKREGKVRRRVWSDNASALLSPFLGRDSRPSSVSQSHVESDDLPRSPEHGHEHDREHEEDDLPDAARQAQQAIYEGWAGQPLPAGGPSDQPTPLKSPLPSSPSLSVAFDRSLLRLRLDADSASAGAGAGCGPSIDLDLDPREEGDARVVAELVRTGRPDLVSLIRSTAQGPTLVAACGPPTLAESVRRAAASANDARAGRSVWAEVESFGW